MINNVINKIYKLSLICTILAGLLSSCDDRTKKGDRNDFMSLKGVGPIKSITLQAIDNNMALEGEKLFQLKCSPCHKIDVKYIGPALKGVTLRRSPEWIMNMILNPDNMIKNDSVAKGLLQKFIAPMANQQLNKEEARKILEYFRTIK